MNELETGGKERLGSFLTPVVDGDVWLVLRSGCFTHSGKRHQ